LTAATWIGAVAGVAALVMGGVSAGDVLPVASATLAPGVRAEVASERLWFNRRSGIFHLPTCIYYTQTKEGVFLNVEEAERIGTRCGHCLGARRRPPEGSRSRKDTGPVKVYVMP
jgi:hypothetical protein